MPDLQTREEENFPAGLNESVDLVCKFALGVSGGAGALVMANGSGALAALFTSGVATGGAVLVPIVGGAIVGFLFGKMVCPGLSKKYLDDTRAQLGGGLSLLAPDRRLLKSEVERVLGLKVSEDDFMMGLDYAAVVVKKSIA